jgi:hypothetical protein
LGLGLCFLIGGGSGAAIGFASGDDWFGSAEGKVLFIGAGLGIVGGLVGLLTGAHAGLDKTIQIEGKSDFKSQPL